MKLLVTPEWLYRNLANPRLHVIDAGSYPPDVDTKAYDEYCKAHIPGALFLDNHLLKDQNAPLPRMVPSLEKIEYEFGRLGLDPDDMIVIYDNLSLPSAARAWWLFMLHEYRHVMILDGGFARWKAERLPVESGAAIAPSPIILQLSRNEALIRTRNQVMHNIASGHEVVVDARAPKVFSGEAVANPALAPGHIPHSLNLPYEEMLDANGCWKTPTKIEKAFVSNRINLEQPLLFTCGAGRTAPALLFAARLLGKRDVSLYDGSWEEWGSDPDTPKETGPAFRESTRLITAGRRREWVRGKGGSVVNPPVWRASTILFDSVEDLREASSHPDDQLYYGRRGTPTQWALSEALTELHPGAEATMLYPSGVAALSMALLSALEAGDELLMVDSCYEPTRVFCDTVLKAQGINVTYYDPLIGQDIEQLFTPQTRAIFMESPGSLTFEVQDIPGICEVAHRYSITTILDNTWATPLFFPAIERGIDLSVMACTKYITGHSDTMMGSVTAIPSHIDKLKRISNLFGQYVSPDDANSALKGLRTLEVRLKAHEKNALKIAKWLSEQPEVAWVLHPALSSCPGHEFWHRDFKGSSGLFSFVLEGGDDRDRTALIDSLEHFGIGFSWGGYESLALPVDPQPIRTAASWQAAGPVVRLHIGLEDPDDLIEDLAFGLKRFKASRDQSGF